MLQLRFKDEKLKPLWLAQPEYLIGQAETCALVLRGAKLQNVHAKLTVKGERAVISNLIGDAMIRVNGVPVSKPRLITHGDVLNFGLTEAQVHDSRQKASQQTEKTTIPWVLVPLVTALSGKEYPVTGSMVLGRSNECEICLAVSHLSRKHARLTVTNRGLEVLDLDSANGTFVNGHRVERAILKPGDQVRFDTVSFQITGPHLDAELTTVRPVLKVAESRDRKAKPVVSTVTPAKPQPAVPMKPAYAAAEAVSVKHSRQHALSFFILACVVLIAAMFVFFQH